MRLASITRLLTLSGLTLCIACCADVASAAEAEHWRCQMKIGEKVYPQDWTLVENRMFAPKGKGSFHLVYNTEKVAFAYFQIQKKDAAPTIFLYVFDKRQSKGSALTTLSRQPLKGFTAK